MEIKKLVHNIIEDFNEKEITLASTEVLQQIPPETIYLSLKESDWATSLWLFENLKTEQLQSLIDIDCWKGDQFCAERYRPFFSLFSLMHPTKLKEHMKNLDPEIIVRNFIEYAQIIKYDHEEPPDVEEHLLLISPDHAYAFVFYKEDREIKEEIYQWMNKLYAGDLDLSRRILESCIWEQKSELEEFAYTIKKGRLEENGFLDKHEAVKIFSTGNAPSFKEFLLDHPLKKEYKKSIARISGSIDEKMLPEAITSKLFTDNFFTNVLSQIEDTELREALGLEAIRSLNALLITDDIFHKDLIEIQNAVELGRHYLNLGLTYLSGANPNLAVDAIETQSFLNILRLGWLLSQDLVKAAQKIKANEINYFPKEDKELVLALDKRHPEISPLLLQDLGCESRNYLSLEGVTKIATRLGEIASFQSFCSEDLADALNNTEDPIEENENAFSRLLTGVLRQASSLSFSTKAMSKSEWETLVQNFNIDEAKKIVQLMSNKTQPVLKNYFYLKLNDVLEEFKVFLNTNKDFPDAKFFSHFRVEKRVSNKD